MRRPSGWTETSAPTEILCVFRAKAGCRGQPAAFYSQKVPHVEYLWRQNIGEFYQFRDEAAAAVIKMIALQIEMEPEETEADRKKIN